MPVPVRETECLLLGSEIKPHGMRHRQSVLSRGKDDGARRLVCVAPVCRISRILISYKKIHMNLQCWISTPCFLEQSQKLKSTTNTAVGIIQLHLINLQNVSAHPGYHVFVVCFPGVTTLCACIFHSPVAGFSLLVFEVSWSHTTTRHSR